MKTRTSALRSWNSPRRRTLPAASVKTRSPTFTAGAGAAALGRAAGLAAASSGEAGSPASPASSGATMAAARRVLGAFIGWGSACSARRLGKRDSYQESITANRALPAPLERANRAARGTFRTRRAVRNRTSGSRAANQMLPSWSFVGERGRPRRHRDPASEPRPGRADSLSLPAYQVAVPSSGRILVGQTGSVPRARRDGETALPLSTAGREFRQQYPLPVRARWIRMRYRTIDL